MGHFRNGLFQTKVNMATELAISSFDNDLLSHQKSSDTLLFRGYP